ncbi:MAG TPA: DUF3592 domain-containing protein [Chitinophagaceae bacterium]|nr:DUF3592 domain-containing protein [Chitinophagaceae bacterium]
MATHIIIVIMGSALFFIVWQMLTKYRELKNGEKTDGVVDGFEARKQKRTTLNIPVIRFTTADQKTISRLSEDSILSARITKGTKVTVLYDPANPERFVAWGRYFKTYTRTVLILSSIFTLFGLILILNDLNIIHLFKQY